MMSGPGPFRPRQDVRLVVRGLDGQPIPVKTFDIHHDLHVMQTQIHVVLDFDGVRLAEYTRELNQAPSLDNIVRAWQKESTQCQQS